MNQEAGSLSASRLTRILTVVALLPILSTVYQTLVLTDLADGDIRRGIESDPGDSTWLSAAWGLSTLYGVFGGLGLSKKLGPRNTLILGLLCFTAGNLLCGMANGFAAMIAARIVEGLGKGACIVLLRSFLLSRFDQLLFAGVLCYGLFAYATRGSSPLVATILNETAGWHWVYWMNVPLGLTGAALILLLVPPDSAHQVSTEADLKPDKLVIHLLITWLMSMLFILGWRAPEGGFTSNLFTALVACSILIFLALVTRLNISLKKNDSIGRLLRSKDYFCAMGGRMLLLLHLAAVMGVLSKYMVELRGFPQVTAGKAFMPATFSMAIGFLLSVNLRKRAWRHFSLVTGVIGASIAVYWLAKLDLTTSWEQVALRVAVWAFFVGTLPASFLIDEVEGLDKSDMPIAAAFAIVVLATPLIIVPAWMGTAVNDGKEAAYESFRPLITPNRPVVEATYLRSMEHFTSRGLDEIQAPALSTGLLIVMVQLQSANQGIQAGLRLLSFVTAILGITISLPLLLSPGIRKTIVH